MTKDKARDALAVRTARLNAKLDALLKKYHRDRQRLETRYLNARHAARVVSCRGDARYLAVLR